MCFAGNFGKSQAEATNALTSPLKGPADFEAEIAAYATANRAKIAKSNGDYTEVLQDWAKVDPAMIKYSLDKAIRASGCKVKKDARDESFEAFRSVIFSFGFEETLKNPPKDERAFEMDISKPLEKPLEDLNDEGTIYRDVSTYDIWRVKECAASTTQAISNDPNDPKIILKRDTTVFSSPTGWDDYLHAIGQMGRGETCRIDAGGKPDTYLHLGASDAEARAAFAFLESRGLARAVNQSSAMVAMGYYEFDKRICR